MSLPQRQAVDGAAEHDAANQIEHDIRALAGGGRPNLRRQVFCPTIRRAASRRARSGAARDPPRSLRPAARAGSPGHGTLRAAVLRCPSATAKPSPPGRAFDTDVPGDLSLLRQTAQSVDRPRGFVRNQPGDRKAPIFWDHAGLPNWIISVEAERSGDGAHRIGFGKDAWALLSVSGPSRIADGAARSRRRGHFNAQPRDKIRATLKERFTRGSRTAKAHFRCPGRR